MKAYLMDVYRKGNKLILWLKTPEDIRIEMPFTSYIYSSVKGKKYNIAYKKVKKKTYLRKYKEVLEIKIPSLSKFESFIREFERVTKHRVPLYNADIKPEQMFLYKNNLRPCTSVIITQGKIAPFPTEEIPPLKKIELKIDFNSDIIKKITLNQETITGSEKEILEKFTKLFKRIDPDVIVARYAFSHIPLLYNRLKENKINCPLHRFDPIPLKYRGGRSFWTYGQVRYRDYAIRLRGRFLVDTNSFVGTECDVEGIVELATLSGTLFQETASRSFGAAFQWALIREMIMRDILVPFKEKPIESPISMLNMLKCDRAGHTIDPKIGFHSNVAEIDFTSMFPWLIYNHNISADAILTNNGPFVNVPGVPIKTTLAYKGLIPIALKPFIDRRMYYKKNPTALNKRRALGLKWVLVSCYGYLRFREFKLGIPSSHMAICAYARETILKVITLAEKRGFTVVHAIVDSVYIKKKDMSDVKKFCEEVELLTGIPISFEGIFKWIVFLPSVLDKKRALPSTYYGVFENGSVKTRGIEIRRRSTPKIVAAFQLQIIEMMKECSSKREVRDKFSFFCMYLKDVIKKIPKFDKENLIVNIRVAKTEYKYDIPQKIIVNKLKKKDIEIMPGQFIQYIFQKNKIVLPEEYNGKPNIEEYKKQLIRSLFNILQPFDFTKENIIEKIGIERQTKLNEFVLIIHKYIPIYKEYNVKKGLSEKIIRKRLEKQGYIVWRGGLIGILKREKELYPNVIKKYRQLNNMLNPKEREELEYINQVHHGMPDFLVYKNNEFKFIECKLQYEILAKNQKKCIQRLTKLGFKVEIHKVVDKRTKIRRAEVEIFNGAKIIREEQLMIN